MKKLRKTQAALNLPTLTLEGALFLPDQLEQAAPGRADWQTEADYGTPRGLKLKDDYSRAFQIACAQWKHFAARMERADVEGYAITRTFVQELLRDAFGYTAVQTCGGITLNERTYPVSLLADTGIATDDSTKAFFGHITQTGRLVSLYDIENRDKLFAAVDSRMKFCLLTLGAAEKAGFVCFATQVSQLADPRRRFTLTAADFTRINPNTLTCPVFRSSMDAELTRKMYAHVPILIKDQE